MAERVETVVRVPISQLAEDIRKRRRIRSGRFREAYIEGRDENEAIVFEFSMVDEATKPGIGHRSVGLGSPGRS